MDRHPIFDAFRAFHGEPEVGFYVDFIGSKIDKRFLGERFAPKRFVTTAPLPGFDEEYFEWIDVLEAVKSAKDRFTFVELGAGFGRWTAIASKAAEQCGIRNFRALLVEAEPAHARWAHEHMRNNRIKDFSIKEAAVGPTSSKTMFVVSKIDKSFPDSPEDWYGQCLNWTDPSQYRPTNQVYEGLTLVDNGGGWGMIEVPVEPLSHFLEPYERIDLLDMDIQGAEADVIETSHQLLTGKVKRVHIGTHSQEVEARIRTAMTTLGWQNQWDFPCMSAVQTPYGVIKFNDGVQSWINPKFIRRQFRWRLGRNWFGRRRLT